MMESPSFSNSIGAVSGLDETIGVPSAPTTMARSVPRRSNRMDWAETEPASPTFPTGDAMFQMSPLLDDSNKENRTLDPFAGTTDYDVLVVVLHTYRRLLDGALCLPIMSRYSVFTCRPC